MLYSPFHIHDILKLAPAPSQENAFGAHFLQLYRKNEQLTPTFCFMILVRSVFSFHEKKNGINLCLFFGNFIKEYGLSHNGSNSECANQVHFGAQSKNKGIRRHFSGTSVDKQYIQVKFQAMPHASSKKSLLFSPSAESRKFGFMAHSRGTAETCHILIFDY